MLPPEIKAALTESSFKYKLKQTDEFKIIPTPKWFSYGDRKLNIILTQLRYNCSSLNQDLANNHVIDDPTCKNCTLNVDEHKRHFFLYCPKYALPRRKLFHTLDDLHINHELETLINGSIDENIDTNKNIVDAVHTFLSETHRFI